MPSRFAGWDKCPLLLLSPRLMWFLYTWAPSSSPRLGRFLRVSVLPTETSGNLNTFVMTCKVSNSIGQGQTVSFQSKRPLPMDSLTTPPAYWNFLCHHFLIYKMWIMIMHSSLIMVKIRGDNVCKILSVEQGI